MPIHFLLVHDAVFPAYPGIGIGQQQNREAVFVAKTRVTDAIVTTDSHDDGVLLRKRILKIGEFVRFHRAARRVVPRVEVQHDIVSALLSDQLEHLHVGIRQLEVRRLHSSL